VRLAYCIFAHQRPSQLRRLMRAIWRPQHIYLIHIDARANAACHDAVRDLAFEPNVALLEPRATPWGGWGIVRTELRAMRRLLERGDWTYYVNLSGQDFPLQTQEEIAVALERLPRRDWVQYEHTLDPERATELARREMLFSIDLPWRDETLIRFTPPWRTMLLEGATRYLGSQWKIVTRETCEFLVQPRNTRRFRAAYWGTRLPDESFFQTVLLNSSRRGTVAGHNWHFIDWESGPQHPRIFGIDDLPRLEASDAFFARKFDERVDDAVLVALEQRLGLREAEREREIA
jgi:hypothetical protein